MSAGQTVSCEETNGVFLLALARGISAELTAVDPECCTFTMGSPEGIKSFSLPEDWGLVERDVGFRSRLTL